MRIFTFLCLMVVAAPAFAQTKTMHPCAAVKRQAYNGVAAKPTVEDNRENNYDVKYVHLDLEVNNMNTQIKGISTTNAVVTATSMGAYVFELTDQLTIDSLKFNGNILPSTGSGYLREVSLPVALTQGTPFTAIVYYHGEPTSGSGFFTGGIQNEISPTWGARVTYTLSESFASRDWWPAKQSLTDKIDSSDVWLTISSNLKGGSNGVLEHVTTLPGNKSRYEWKNHNPIDYYLISLAVSTYDDYSHYMHFDNSTDSMLMQHYVYSNPGTLPYWKDQIDSTDLMVNYFSSLFGRYPFWKEKYGHCMAPLGGGMEHQTMTTLGTFDTWLIAHEFGHQWFGDHVTCGSWADIWLNEGFASYCEYLYAAHFNGTDAGIEKMDEVHDNVMSSTGGSVYCIDSTNENSIFDSRLSYDKGSAIIHTLRFVAGNDNLFFNTLKDYQIQYANATATTEQFKSFVAGHYNRNMDTFFNQWIYGEGYPTISAKWNQVNGHVTIELSQVTSMPQSVSYFNTPLEVKLTALGSDTTVLVNFNAATKSFECNWSKSMNGLTIDPDNWILNKTGNIVKDPALSINELQLESVRVFPNPTNNDWTVSNLNEASDLYLTDISGRTLWHVNSGNQKTMTIHASRYPNGIYFLKLTGKGNNSKTLKLVKVK